MFEDAETGTPLLYFVPYQVIPTIPEAPTVRPNQTNGVHRFALVEPSNHDDTFHIGVLDEINPFPSSLYLRLEQEAMKWSLLHLSRAAVTGRNVDWIQSQTRTLQKYLVNILTHPEVWKYRSLRIASKHFAPIWASPLKGLLLAAGFVEESGYCTLGTPHTALNAHRIRDVSHMSLLLSEWMHAQNSASSAGLPEQPAGSMDGFGRAGFGRAGDFA